MGLLDDAIKEHLELKRRRGADAGEISRLESEALGPVRRSADGVPDLSDTFLVAGVYNFPPQFSGPQLKTQFDTQPGNPGFNTYGIWNGATVMSIRYTQRYTQSEVGARMPLLQPHCVLT